MNDEEVQEPITRKSMGLVSCDDLLCPALIDPKTNEELFDALEHWQGHNLLDGCSHGR